MKFFFLYLKAILFHPHRACAALFWLLLGKRRRAKNRMGVMLSNVTRAYDLWMHHHEDFSQGAQNTALEDIASFSYLPHFRIVIEGQGSGTDIKLDQWYTNYSLESRELDTAGASCDYLLYLKDGDQLAPNALYEIAKICQVQEYDLITFDDDELTRRHKRVWPYFKPQWNPCLQLSSNYIGLSCAIKASIECHPLEYLASVVRESKQITTTHVSKVLRHIGTHSLHRESRQKITLDDWLDRLNANSKTGGFQLDTIGWVERNVSLPKDKVSIIIPTRDMVKLLQKCVDSVLDLTDYDDFEVLIVDNDSQKAQTLEYFTDIIKDPRVKILSYPGPFNYSSINNFAVGQATGDYICLLNNDTEVITPSWLSDLMKQAVGKHVGAVGAKLLYDDDRIQHAGVVIGLGQLAGHGHRFQRNRDAGYFHRAHQLQQVSAVTAACLVVEKRKFSEVGGLNEADLTVAFNDVDLCLKLDKAGYSNIYQPNAVLYHYESKSRGKDLKGEKKKRYLTEVAYMQSIWQTHENMDRFYSPNLTMGQEDFSINVQ